MLSNDDMKQIVGGNETVESEGGPTVVRGNCTGSTGAWNYGTPVWYLTCWNDITTYCASNSGQCHPA